MLSVSMEMGGNERQLLAFANLQGPRLYEELGRLYGK
jgi:hypothetical protein